MVQSADSVYVLDADLAKDPEFTALTKSWYSGRSPPPRDTNGKEVLVKDFTPPGARPLYILKDFQGELFSRLLEQSKPIMGVPAFLDTIEKGEKLLWPFTEDNRFCPRFNRLLKGVSVGLNICVVDKSRKCMDLIRWMHGMVRQESGKMEILIADSVRGAKYRNFVALAKPVLSPAWLDHIWENRFDRDFEPTSREVMKAFCLRPFTGLRIAFTCFTPEDRQELEKLTVSNGGLVVPLEDKTQISHIVVDGARGLTDMTGKLDFLGQIQCDPKSVHVVFRDWFWASLQRNARENESDPEFVVPLSKVAVDHSNRITTPNGHSAGVSHVSLEKQISMDFDRTINSSVLDSSHLQCDLDSSTPRKTPDYEAFSARRKVCMELLDTERNYVHILKAIISVFKVPLEEMAANESERLLDGTEIRIIFGNLPPIVQLHESICSELEKLVEKKWREHNRIGRVFLQHSESFIKYYPPFVNFFEDTKRTLRECDERDPRFHAFLKRCQSRVECQRQPLTELLIRPVQRLPSLQLLLSELIKKTKSDNPDHVQLNAALGSIKEALKRINEGKRTTEGQIAMFEIVAEIEDCPPNLLSAQRKFIGRVNCKVATVNNDDGTHRMELFRGANLTLFLFNDSIEICKRRSLNRSNSLKQSQATAGPTLNQSRPPKEGGKTGKRAYRHLEFIEKQALKWVYDIKLDSPTETAAETGTHTGSPANDANAIYLLASHGDFRGFLFVIEDELMNKNKFLQLLTTELDIKENFGEMTLENIMYSNGSSDLITILSKNKSMNRARDTISRAFSIRRSGLTASIAPASSLNHLVPPTTPSGGKSRPVVSSAGTPGLPKNGSKVTRRLSRIFSPFVSESGNTGGEMRPPGHGGTPQLPSSRLKFSSMHPLFGSTQSLFALSETGETEMIFGPPSTPTPKKKKPVDNL